MSRQAHIRMRLIARILRPAQYDARQKQAQHQLPNLSIKSQWPKPSAEEVIGCMYPAGMMVEEGS